MATESIANALNRLNKHHWREPINYLIYLFDGVPLDAPLTDELEILLWDLMLLVEKSGTDQPVPIARLFQRRVAELPCWKHRAYVEEAGSTVMWNPLDQGFGDFKVTHVNTHGLESPQHYVGDQAYPAVDVIRKWAQVRFV